MKNAFEKITNFIKSEKLRNAVKKVIEFVNSHKVRVALSLVLIAILFVAPALTQAQYKWKLNGHTILAAKELYFDGNYMHDSTKNASYRTTGWDGRTQPIKQIEVRNFENALLANKVDEDIEYVFNWKVETLVYDENGSIRVGDYRYRMATTDEAYSVEKVTRDSVDKSVDGSGDKIFTHTNSATGIIIGNGNPKKDKYDFILRMPNIYAVEGGALPWNSLVRVTLTATNVAFERDASGTIVRDDFGNAKYRQSDSYSKNISCVFEYVITSGEGYVTRFDPEDSESTFGKLKTWIGTGEVPDSEGKEQIITVWWDKRYLNIDPFNVVFQDMMQKEQATPGAKYYYDTYGTGELANYASLTITGLASYYTGYLDFFKIAGINLQYPDIEGGAIVDHNKSKMDQWFYIYTDPSNPNYQVVTRSLVVLDNDEPVSGKILGYYVGNKK